MTFTSDKITKLKAMERPTKIRVIKLQDGYDLIFTDEMSGSSTGVTITINGYKAMAEHFKSGVMEISSDDIATLHKQNVSKAKRLFCPDEHCQSEDVYFKDNKCMCGYCGEKWAI